MDPVTHGLAGALITEAGFRQSLGNRAKVMLPLVAMSPDLDIIYRIEGLPNYIANHRGLTHSFAGVIVAGVILGAIMGRLDEERRYTAWIAACWVALVSHQLLDLITSYGTIILYPFSHTRFYFDWVFILDLFLTGILLVFWLLSRRREPAQAKRMAGIGLWTAAIYIAFCALNHSLALHQLKAAGRRNQITYVAMAAIPQPFLPFRWSGILDTGINYYQAPFYSLWTPSTPFQVFTKTTGSYFEQRARETDLGALYNWFARYPVVNERAEAGYHIVEFSDLRFYIRLHTFMVRKPFVLRIKMDRDGNILESRFGRM